jgi:hypothetical protein
VFGDVAGITVAFGRHGLSRALALTISQHRSGDGQRGSLAILLLLIDAVVHRKLVNGNVLSSVM